MSGLTSFLQSQQYATANYSQLWDAMSAVTNQPVSDWMLTWTVRRGFPILWARQGITEAGESNEELFVEQVSCSS